MMRTRGSISPKVAAQIFKAPKFAVISNPSTPRPPPPLYKMTLLVRLKASQIDLLAAIAEKFLRQTTANYYVGEGREIIISKTGNKSMPGEKICCEILYLSIICCIDSMSFHFKIYYVTLDVLVVLCNKILHLPKSRGWETQYRRFTEISSSHTLQVLSWCENYQLDSHTAHSTQSVIR